MPCHLLRASGRFAHDTTLNARTAAPGMGAAVRVTERNSWPGPNDIQSYAKARSLCLPQHKEWAFERGLQECLGRTLTKPETLGAHYSAVWLGATNSVRMSPRDNSVDIWHQ
jgi:hypothetical protein